VLNPGGEGFSADIQTGRRAHPAPVQGVPGLLPGDKAGREWRWPPTPLAPRLKKEQSYTSTRPLGAYGLF